MCLDRECVCARNANTCPHRARPHLCTPHTSSALSSRPLQAIVFSSFHPSTALHFAHTHILQARFVRAAHSSSTDRPTWSHLCHQVGRLINQPEEGRPCNFARPSWCSVRALLGNGRAAKLEEETLSAGRCGTPEVGRPTLLAFGSTLCRSSCDPSRTDTRAQTEGNRH